MAFISAPERLAKIDVAKTLRHMASLGEAAQDNIMTRATAEQKRIRAEYVQAGADFNRDHGKMWLLALCMSIMAVGDMKNARTTIDLSKPAEQLLAEMGRELDVFEGKFKKKRASGPSAAKQLDAHRGVIQMMHERGTSLEVMRHFLASKCRIKGPNGKPISKSYLARWVRENVKSQPE